MESEFIVKSIHPISLFLILLFAAGSCEDDTQTQDKEETEEGSWLIYSPIKWPHDGEPLTGTCCKIYSDAASESLKRQCLDFADRMFEEIMEFFQVHDFGGLNLPPENERINVYINTAHDENIAYAYWGTIFITIRNPDLDEGRFAYLFKHELTHELEFLIEGTVNLGTPVWFRESIAIYSGGGFNRITNEADLDSWIRENENYPGKGNPLLIREWTDFPEGASIDRYYWYAFDVVMRYLLDTRGLNRNPADVRNLFYDIADGESFDVAFEHNFALELQVFEEEFYDRIREYLHGINEPAPLIKAIPQS